MYYVLITKRFYWENVNQRDILGDIHVGERERERESQ